jgi:hypothetical protein
VGVQAFDRMHCQKIGHVVEEHEVRELTFRMAMDTKINSCEAISADWQRRRTIHTIVELLNVYDNKFKNIVELLACWFTRLGQDISEDRLSTYESYCMGIVAKCEVHGPGRVFSTNYR